MSNSNPTPVIPTLHAMSTPKLSTPADIATYLIRWMFQNPGGTSSVNEDEMLSFRKIAGAHPHEPDLMASEISEKLGDIMNRYFPDDDYRAECVVSDEEGTGDDGTYLGNKAISIVIRDKNELPVIPMANIKVNDGGESFDIRFTRNNS